MLFNNLRSLIIFLVFIINVMKYASEKINSSEFIRVCIWSRKLTSFSSQTLSYDTKDESRKKLRQSIHCVRLEKVFLKNNNNTFISRLLWGGVRDLHFMINWFQLISNAGINQALLMGCPELLHFYYIFL